MKLKIKWNLSMTKFAPALMVSSMLLASRVEASYSVGFHGSNYTGNYQSKGSSDGEILCQFDNSGNQTGALSTSYEWSSSQNCINYNGGNFAKGTCLVIQDNWGHSYSWNISDWNGTDQIDCHFDTHYFNCSEIKIFGDCRQTCNPPPTSCVPEPSTFLAGSLLMVPLGVQAIRRISRLRKQA